MLRKGFFTAAIGTVVAMFTGKSLSAKIVKKRSKEEELFLVIGRLTRRIDDVAKQDTRDWWKVEKIRSAADDSRIEAYNILRGVPGPRTATEAMMMRSERARITYYKKYGDKIYEDYDGFFVKDPVLKRVYLQMPPEKLLELQDSASFLHSHAMKNMCKAARNGV